MPVELFLDPDRLIDTDPVAQSNQFGISVSRLLMPMGRRLEELKVAEQSKLTIEAPESIEELPRRTTEKKPD